MSELNTNNLLNNEDPHFGLPENYFLNSAKVIQNKLEWQDEHGDFKNLAKLKIAEGYGSHGFKVPVNYFNKQTLRMELLPYSNLYSSKKENKFEVPANYFKELGPTDLVLYLNKKKLVELKNDLRNGNTQTRLIPVFWQRFSMAMAAVLLISLGFWFFKQNVPSQNLNDCKTLACIEEQTILNNLTNLNLENEELYELVNPGELQKELEMNFENPHMIDDSIQPNLNLEDF